MRAAIGIVAGTVLVVGCSPGSGAVPAAETAPQTTATPIRTATSSAAPKPRKREPVVEDKKFQSWMMSTQPLRVVPLADDDRTETASEAPTATTAPAEDAWARRGREVCARLGVAVDKVFVPAG